jgi:hypothetical protein
MKYSIPSTELHATDGVFFLKRQGRALACHMADRKAVKADQRVFHNKQQQGFRMELEACTSLCPLFDVRSNGSNDRPITCSLCHGASYAFDKVHTEDQPSALVKL